MKIGNIKFKGMHGLFKKKGLLFIQGYGVVSDPGFFVGLQRMVFVEVVRKWRFSCDFIFGVQSVVFLK